MFRISTVYGAERLTTSDRAIVMPHTVRATERLDTQGERGRGVTTTNISKPPVAQRAGGIRVRRGVGGIGGGGWLEPPFFPN